MGNQDFMRLITGGLAGSPRQASGSPRLSYGPDLLDDYPRAAYSVDHILKGGKLADLPVQAPTKFELVINIKTAKTLGLVIPESFLQRADEVIE